MASEWFKWFHWERPDDKKPEGEDAQDAAEKPIPPIMRTYTGDWAEQFLEVTMHIPVLDLPTGQRRLMSLALIVPNYNASIVADTLNANAISYSVIPIDQTDVMQGEGQGDG